MNNPETQAILEANKSTKYKTKMMSKTDPSKNRW